MAAKNNLSFFITGTDTDVGKTIVSTILSCGIGSYYWKPIQTGALQGTDTEFVSQYLPKDKLLKEAFSFKAPLSPHIASALEGEAIDWSRLSLPQLYPLVVEGAGGVMVPINSKNLMVDLICEYKLPCIVVCRSTLGTINHSLLTLKVLRSRGVEVAGFITQGDLNLDNIRSIEEYSGETFLGHVPVLAEMSRKIFIEVFASWQGFRKKYLNSSEEGFCDSHRI